MNVFVVYVPKVILLLTVWIPEYELNVKIVLTLLCILNFIFVYDIAKPGHSGKVYKFTDKFKFETGEIIVSALHLILKLTFEFVAILSATWIPAIFEGLLTVFILYELIKNIIDAINNKN